MSTPQRSRWEVNLTEAIAERQKQAIAATEKRVAAALADGRISSTTADRMLAQADPAKHAQRQQLLAKRRRDRAAWKAAQTAKLLGKST